MVARPDGLRSVREEFLVVVEERIAAAEGAGEVREVERLKRAREKGLAYFDAPMPAKTPS